MWQNDFKKVVLATLRFLKMLNRIELVFSRLITTPSMSFLQLFRHISTFIFDVDGVLTDGSLLVLENGDQVRRMNIKDGYAQPNMGLVGDL